MKIKSRFGIFCLVIMLMLANKSEISAVGIMASDFGWKNVGQDSFLITLTLYNDCNSSSPGDAKILFRCMATGVKFDSIIITEPTGIDVTPVCSSTQSRCQNSGSTFPYGVNKYIYSAIIRLNQAGSCCSIDMSYKACCRDASITTGSANSNFYTEAEFDRCTSLTDNAPSFSNPPVKILCVGQDVNYNSGIIDQDTNSTGGAIDSFTYDWECGGTFFFYSGQYSCYMPIYFWGFPNDALPFPRGLHLDHSTGDLQFRPMRVEVAPMSIEINEFRNGSQIARVRREMEMIVISCTSNSPPHVYTPNDVRNKSVCAGSTVSFSFSSNDPNTNDTVTLSWNESIPGASWSTTNGQVKHATATLSWTPREQQVSSIPYTFTVTAKDNACPVSSLSTQAYQINVKPVPEASYSVVDTGCGKFYFEAIPVKGSHINYQWTGSGGINYNSSTFIHQYKIPGTYPFRFSYSSSGCGSSINDTIRTGTFLWIKLPKDTTICKGNSITLSAQSFNATGNLHYQWSTIQGDTLTSKTFRVYSDTNIILWITDNSGCTAKDTIRIKIYLPYVFAGRDTVICRNDSAILRVKGIGTFKWSNGDASVTTKVKPLVTQYFHVTITDTNNCPASDSVLVWVNSLPNADAGPDQAICLNQTVSIIASGGYKYLWNTGEKKNYITKTPLVSTKYFVKVTDFNNCSFNDTVYVKVNPLPIIFAGPDQDICSLKGYHNLSGTPDSTMGNGYWTGRAVFKDSTGLWNFDPNATGIMHLGKYPVFYHFTDSNGCSNSDTAVLTVYNESPVDAGQYNKQCIDGSPVTLTGNPPGGYWTGNAVIDSFFDPVKAGIGFQRVVYHNLYTVCPNTDTTYIEVVPLPNTQISTYNGKTEFCPQGLIALNGSPAGGTFGGQWTGDAEQKYYFNTSRSEGSYFVIYSFTDYYGCKNTDTLFLRVSLPKITIDTTQKNVCYGSAIMLKSTYNFTDNIIWSKDTSSNGYFIGSTNFDHLIFVPGTKDYLHRGCWIKIRTISNLCNADTDSIYIRAGYYPKPNFSADSLTGNFPRQVMFTNLSTIQNGSITGFIWDFGDSSFSNVQNPLHTYLNTGSYDVKLTTLSDIGCKDSIIKYNYITTTSSVNEDKNVIQLTLYPNPANSYVKVSFADNRFKIARLYIYNASGMLILDQKNMTQNYARINTEDFKTGLYLLKVISENGLEYLAKFVKE